MLGIELAANQRGDVNAHELYGDVEALRLVDLDREGLSTYRDQLNRTQSSSAAAAQETPIVSTSTAANNGNQPRTASQYDLAASIQITIPSTYSPQQQFYGIARNNFGPTHSTLEGVHHQRQRPGVSAPKSPSIHRQIQQQQQQQQAKKTSNNKIAPVEEANNTSSEKLSEMIDELFGLEADSRLSVEEAEKSLLRVNSRLGRRLGEDDVKLFFAKLDVKCDGTIGSNDFKSALVDIHQQKK